MVVTIISSRRIAVGVVAAAVVCSLSCGVAYEDHECDQPERPLPPESHHRWCIM